MATPIYSQSNDTFQRSIYKIANNFYVAAIAVGYAGDAPNPSSSPERLLSQIVDYTAFLT